MIDELDREHAAILRESRLGTFHPRDLPLEEAWSDAARAASIAARRARAVGHNWRKAGRTAYRKYLRREQGMDIAHALTTAAHQADTQSFNLLPRGGSGAQGILKRARRRAEQQPTDRAFWAARKGVISQALSHKARRFAYA